MTKLDTKAPLNFCGSIAKICLSHDGKPEGLSVIENDLAFGYATPLHIHLNQDEIFQVLSGCMCFEVNGEQIHAQPGDLLRAPKGVPHRFIVTSEEGARALVFTVGPDFESLVIEGSLPVTADQSDLPRMPLAEEIAALSAATAKNGLELIGPPLAIADTRLRAA